VIRERVRQSACRADAHGLLERRARLHEALGIAALGDVGRGELERELAEDVRREHRRELLVVTGDLLRGRRVVRIRGVGRIHGIVGIVWIAAVVVTAGPRANREERGT
jgi:hypothetical protein